jgi:hypothetical protein
MARLVGAYATTHSPFCYRPPEEWNDARARRALRTDVPHDDLATNQQKADRVLRGFAALRAELRRAAPDVLVVFGDDQRETFDFSNYPTLSLYLGEEFRGVSLESSGTGVYEGSQQVTLRGHPELATRLLLGLMSRGFDPAFSLEMPERGHGMPHAVMNPVGSLTDLTIPVVPILLNCFYTPQITARRCYQLGKAVRAIIEDDTLDLRVAVVGSGGLWHTPAAEGAYLDEAFDRMLLSFMERGDAQGMARAFDGYRASDADSSQVIGRRGARSEELRAAGYESTGLPGLGGPQGGTRETCCWIAAAAVADGVPATVVDYVPLYASPIGAGFVYWEFKPQGGVEVIKEDLRLVSQSEETIGGAVERKQGSLS